MADPTPQPEPRPSAPITGGSVTPLWRNSGFTLMWASVAASGFGDRIIMSAALILLGSMAAETDAGRVSFNAATQFWFFLPYLVLSFSAGWLADKLPRKWILLTCDEARAVVLAIALIGVLGLSGDPVLPADQRWLVYLTLFLVGSLAATFNPTRNAIIPQIVAQRQLQAANALIVGLGVVAAMIGGLAASFIMNADKGETIKVGLIIAVAFYAVSGSFFAFLKPSDSHRAVAETDRSLKQAMKYIVSHKAHVRLIGVYTLTWGAAMIVYNAALTFGHLHFGFVGDRLFGHYQFIAATIGGGMLLGAGVISAIGTQRESTLVLKVSLIGAALAMLVFTLVPHRPVHFASGLLIGVFGNMAIINVLSMLQVLSPNYIRGRVMGLANIVSTVGTVTINGVIWQLPNADAWMPGVVLATAGLLIAVGGVGLFYTLTHGPMPNRLANAFWRTTRFFVFSYHRLSVRGKHYVPAEGPVIIVANHTTAMDPFLIQSSVNRLVRWLMLQSYRFRLGEPLWKAIDPICLEQDPATGEKEGAGRQVRQIVRELKKGDLVGVFPEGHLQYDSRIVKPFQPGAAVMGKLAKATIVPCWIDGTAVSKRMVVHVLKPGHTSVTFGPAFRVDPKASPEQSTALIRERVMDAARRSATPGGRCPKCGASVLGMYERGENNCPGCGAVVLDPAAFDPTPF
ncbi:MAG: MFS transporter [Planctomycetota bacterium]